jgi:hypothetical protein
MGGKVIFMRSRIFHFKMVSKINGAAGKWLYRPWLGTMDLKEVTAVIDKLREMGGDPEPFTAADMGDGELDFDEFCGWYLKQEGLPDGFAPPKPGGIPKVAMGGEATFMRPCI